MSNTPVRPRSTRNTSKEISFDFKLDNTTPRRPFGSSRTRAGTPTSFFSPFQKQEGDRLSDRLFPSFGESSTSRFAVENEGPLFGGLAGATFRPGVLVGEEEFGLTGLDSPFQQNEERKFEFPTDTRDDNVFGFGDFHNVFVTEEDLVRNATRNCRQQTHSFVVQCRRRHEKNYRKRKQRHRNNRS